jgi:hypothetical protein
VSPTLSLSSVFTTSGHLACYSFPLFYGVYAMYIYMCIYIYIFAYVNIQEKLCPYISSSPHPWLLRDGVLVLGWSPQCFNGEGCLPKIIVTVSSPGKGAASPSLGASSTSMPRDKDHVVMKLFIRL